MSTDSSEEQVEALLAEGLDLYGADDVSQAIITWNKALELDPDNAAARDYIESADRRKTPRDESGAGSDPSHAHLREVEKCVSAGEFEPALELLETHASAQAVGLPVEAMLELLRSRLLHAYREAVGDFATVPVLKDSGTSIQKLNLPPDAGFMLSLIDGATSVADLITLSGMDAFDALRTLLRLDEAGIVGVPE